MLLVLVVSGGFPITERLLGDLLVFLYLHLRSGYSSRLEIVRGMSVIFDSEVHLEESLPGRIEEAFSSGGRDPSKDLGYALLLAHKEKKKEGRILFFFSGGSPLNLIKCAFTARKWSIPINCVISSERFTSQIGNVFKGSSFLISSSRSLFEFLLQSVSLQLGHKERDASVQVCICHRKEIRTGYICPICLGLYCAFVPLCKHCKTKFVF